MNISFHDSQRPHIDFAHSPVVTQQMQPISLEEMDAIRLMNRIDTKYVTDERILMDILRDAAAQGYRVFTIDGRKVSSYDSLYYDTRDLRMFCMHHNRRLVRQKVRTRVYEGATSAFLEIKRKNNKGRTQKKRVQISLDLFEHFTDDNAASEFLAAKSSYRSEQLLPELETAFRRITLVNREKTERLTIDTQLVFRNRRTKIDATLGTAAIIELKQDGHADSPMKHILMAHRVKPMRVSKYCIGVTLTQPDVKANRFKRKVRRIERTVRMAAADSRYNSTKQYHYKPIFKPANRNART